MKALTREDLPRWVWRAAGRGGCALRLTLLAMLGLGPLLRAGTIGLTGKLTTAEYNWYAPSAYWFTTYAFSGTIADRADASGKIAGSGVRTEWRDVSGVPLQGDGRYSRYTGTFHLKVNYAQSPTVPVTATVLTVHFTNGVADGAWPGEGLDGTPGQTGRLSVAKLKVDDPHRLVKLGDPVQIATGAVTDERTLFAFAGARSWQFGLSYHSALASSQTSDGPVGIGWTHSFETRVVASGANLVLQWNSVRANTFTPDPGTAGTYRSTETAAQQDVLAVQPGGGWLLTRRDQSSQRFNAAGRLVEERDPHARRLALTYDASGRIATLVDPVSAAGLTFGYVAGTPAIATLTDGTGAVVTLDYETRAGPTRLLRRLVNPNGQQVTFTYNANRALLSVCDHEGTVLTANTYDALDRVVAQDDGVAGNQPLGFAYSEQGLAGGNLYAASDGARGIPLILPSLPFLRTETFTNRDGRTIQNTFDPVSGRLVAAALDGQVTTLTYDVQGQVAAVTDPAGRAWPVTPGITVETIDRTGQRSTRWFDPEYNLRSFTNPLQQTTRYAYDLQHNVTAVTDALERTTRFTHDAAGNVLTATDPAGQVTSHTYDARNNRLTTTDPLGQVTRRTYDEWNNLRSLTEARGAETRWTYDANSRPLTWTLPRGGVHRYTYDAGRLAQSTDPGGVVTKYRYDAAGRLLQREDAAGRCTTHTYDASGNLLTLTNALNETTTQTYDHRHRLRTCTDATGAVTTHTYDPNGNRLTSTDALGHVTTWTYDGEDRLLTVRDALEHTTRFTYDAAGRLTGTTDAAGNLTAYEYDAAGQPSAVIDALGRRTTSEREGRGLLAKVTDPLGRCSGYEYDALGRRTGERDPLERTTGYAYDALGRLTRVTDAGGRVAVQAYDVDGNRTSFTNPLGNVTTLASDPAGRLVTVTTAEGRATGQVYEARGLLATVSGPSGQTTDCRYDAAQRLDRLTDGVGVRTFTRDAAGRVLTVGEGTRTLARAYEARGRLVAFTDGEGNRIGYTYDAVGHLTRLTYPDGRQVSYRYDTAGQLSHVTDWAGRETAYAYDAVGRVTLMLRPNGTKQTRQYDAAGRVIELKEIGPDGIESLLAVSHRYDVGGQLTGEAVSPALDAPVSALNQTFDRDNRLRTHNGAVADCDAAGNLRTIAFGVTPASYTYDTRNRLTGAGGLTYTYDAENRRVGLTDAKGATRYVVNPNAALDQVLRRTAPDGSQTCYVYGLGLLHEESGAGVRYYHCDRRGNTVALTDSRGVVTDRMGYGPHGERLGRTGTQATPFLFSGEWGVQTDGNGLSYHRARYYHPALRRFLNEDPLLGRIAVPASLNRWAYTRGNPVSFIDPTGDYDRDVHYDLTRSLALRAGWTPAEAAQIAAADQRVDDDVRTGPYGDRTASNNYHFSAGEFRERLRREAYAGGNNTLFGQYLHAEQDSYSHQRGQTGRDGEPYTPLVGHFFAGFAPDQTDLRPELSVQMAERTYQELRKFNELTRGRKTCDDWNNIRPVVAHRVRIKSPD